MGKLKPRKIAITLAAIGLMSCGELSGLNGTPGTNPMNSAGLVRASQLAVKPATGEGAAHVAAPGPVFRDASVHDPSVIKVGDTFYVFGSHLAAAKSKDFMQWDKVAMVSTPTTRCSKM